MIPGDTIAQFRDFIASVGFTPPERIEPGQIARFTANGKPSNTSAWAKLFPDLEGGVVGNWATGDKWTWQVRRERTRNNDEQRAFREKCERAQREAAALRERELRETAERAERIWRDSKPADDSHPYLTRKGVRCFGLRLYRGPLSLRGMRCEGALIIPRRTVAGDLASLQFISPNGDKRYLNGPVPPGTCFLIGKANGVRCIPEGYATAASVHAATGYCVAMAFEAGNLEPAAKALRQEFPDEHLIVCADDDWKTVRNGEPYNTGIEAARAAALAVDGHLAIPNFGEDRAENATDFNDLHQSKGLEAVRKAVEAAHPPQVSVAQPTAEDRSGAILASPSSPEWPAPLAPEAFQGLAGEIVRFIEPHTESDPSAILLQALVAFGALVGRGPHVPIEGSQHHSNLFAIVVGRSSKARKGTSWGRILTLCRPILGWPRVVEGLSSGEGLKYAVRDPVRKQEKDKAGYIAEVEVDAGVSDKRVLVVESEFAQVLRQCARPGNTLSATVRSAWDSGNLQTLTKNDPTTATGAHVCMIGHITSDELRAELTATDSANGFANRFILMAAERSKLLPFGGDDLDPELQQHLSDRIADAVRMAQGRGAMGFSSAARDVWRGIYPVLSEGHPGLLGAVTARAEAQTLRLALLFALMDRVAEIDVPHLQAAIAVWERAEASARFVFGSAIGDRIADAILRSLRESAQRGMTRTQISKLFSQNETADRISAGLSLLESRGLVRHHKAEGPGRPAEIWEAA